MCYVVQISSGFGTVIYGVCTKVTDKTLDEEWFLALSSIVILDLVHCTVD